MEIASLRDELIYNNDKVSIKVLMETATSREIRILLKKGQKMNEHKTSYPITVEVHHGEINFGAEGTNIDLKIGDLIYLNPSIPHNLVAIEDSIVRLTLSKTGQY